MGTYNQVPEQHVRTSTYKVAHTTQVPHTGYTTSYRTEEVPYAKKAGYLRRLAEASTDTDAAQASLTKKGTLKYGEKVVSTYTTKTPYTVQVPHTYTTKVPHTTTYYKTKTNYKYVAKPYTVVTHLVCTPSAHTEYRCPACHDGTVNYNADGTLGVADSYGDWMSPKASGFATHVYHHVYHASDAKPTAASDATWSYNSDGFVSKKNPEWKTLHYNGKAFVAAKSATLAQAASVESATVSHKSSSGVVGVALIALVAMRRKTSTPLVYEDNLSIL